MVKAGGETFASLPSELRDYRSPQITRIYASDDKTQISQFYDEFRSDVPLKDISKHMRDAIVASEDREFYQHNGVDLKGVARAFVNNNNGRSRQGASTITMQWVRMSLAYSATTPREVRALTVTQPSWGCAVIAIPGRKRGPAKASTAKTPVDASVDAHSVARREPTCIRTGSGMVTGHGVPSRSTTAEHLAGRPWTT